MTSRLFSMKRERVRSYGVPEDTPKIMASGAHVVMTTTRPTPTFTSGGDEQTLKQIYFPEGNASCVQNFDDSRILQFA